MFISGLSDDDFGIAKGAMESDTFSPSDFPWKTGGRCFVGEKV